MPKQATDLAVRKKMRKGTHSCFECRRRKIRCIFPPDNSDVCSECFARGSRCVDQEHASPDVIVDHRKNLRERVSRLEALVDSLLEDKVERSVTDTSSSKTPNMATRDTFPPTPLSSDASSAVVHNALQNTQRAPSDRGHHIPILSIFEDALNDAEDQARTCPSLRESLPVPGVPQQERITVTCKNLDDMMEENSLNYQAKRERAKQALMATLPPYDQLNKILASNSEWWQTWRRKCSGTSTSGQSLSSFASKALADGNIGAIGTVVLSVAICSADEGDVDRYIETVDRWVLSDDEYAATLEGMECLILKAKWYADVGQPRRAWIAHRKGLMYIQLMGLHRKRTTSAAHESVWWSLYHGDRFLSLLLGLPYGVSDSHCDLSLPDMPDGPYMAPLVFINKVSFLAGKVIDRNQGIAEQSYAWALQLDQELEDIWKQLDPAWLEFSELLADVEKNAAELRERLMAQIIYHQIRVYLHLPFMLKSQSNSRFAYSRTACLTGSREVLRMYQALRTGAVQPLYECKAVDFIGFTAAVLIQLGLFNFGAAKGALSAKEKESDVRLIEISIDIFRRASSEKGGKVALQSAEVLEKMLSKFKMDFAQGGGKPPGGGCGGGGDCVDLTEFVIPYFGTISIRRGGRPTMPSPVSNSRTTPVTLNPQSNLSSPSQFTPSSENGPSTNSQSPFSAATLTPRNNSTTTPATDTSSTFSFSNNDPFVSYNGFYNWGNITDTATTLNPSASTNGAAGTSGLGAHVNDDSMNNYPLPTNNFSWQNMPMDIDQDWSWFLNDHQAGSASASAQTGGQTVGDQFTQSGFVGFG
ncbi:hypothetical protein K504DRAFT_380369 [Pleomassaria siparia CBS 279.74]|uniref:Zn(2)-C6 fungal-type domain-containing protein n=1 Tax=Pleomassaria siparia CBS 279.74 TaxID=1314801 RepID=A0A6G1K700_9PLEO|nr:hypothetical protein K504DRAFT_380369 [Pleomassaria siparia CBS 279.74]